MGANKLPLLSHLALLPVWPPVAHLLGGTQHSIASEARVHAASCRPLCLQKKDLALSPQEEREPSTSWSVMLLTIYYHYYCDNESQ